MKKRIGLILIAALVLGSTLSFADTKSKKIDAWFYNIKVIINGQTLNTPLEPFIYNDNTYVPLRPIVEGMGGTPTWNGETKTITIQGNASTEVANLKNEITKLKVDLNISQSEVKSKDEKIKTLEEKIKKLEDDEDDDDKDSDLDDLKDTLDDDYDKYTDDSSGKMNFSFSLDKSGDTVKVKMKGDFSKSDDVWKDRDEGDFQDFIEKITDEIHDDKDFDDCDVEVTVKDEDSKTIGEYKYDESKDKFSVEDED